MNRRTSLKYLATAGIITSAGGGYFWLAKDREHTNLAIEAVLGRLKALDIENIKTEGAWGAARTLNHLAQSVEFSMTGYPDMKPKLFRQTVGQLAFSVFQANGRMTHGTDEEIPGEVINLEDKNATVARERLITALENFDAITGALHPHFAYGQLSKTQYSIAHAMHVDDHLFS